MITAVDSSVLLDILSGDREFGEASRRALRECTMRGALVACEVVWAEVAGWFKEDSRKLVEERLRVEFDAMQLDAAITAGRAWQRYRAARGPRQSLIADFLIGAHAATQADRLLARDRGFYRRYFTDLNVIEPSALSG